jgi:hypothetical protein
MPAKAGIQFFGALYAALDSRSLGNERNLLRDCKYKNGRGNPRPFCYQAREIAI